MYILQVPDSSLVVGHALGQVDDPAVLLPLLLERGDLSPQVEQLLDQPVIFVPRGILSVAPLVDLSHHGGN